MQATVIEVVSRLAEMDQSRTMLPFETRNDRHEEAQKREIDRIKAKYCAPLYKEREQELKEELAKLQKITKYLK
jgi:hypothetical protein